MVELFIIAFSLGLDAFSLAVSFGMCQNVCSVRSKFRISFSFGFFQFLMPILGFILGRSFLRIVDRYDHWIVFFILLLVGGKVLIDGFKPEETKKNIDISSGIPLIIASIATSIDAFGVGISFAFLKKEVIVSSLVIGLVAGFMSWIGVNFGSHIGKNWIKKPELIGGIAIIAIAIKSLMQGL